MSRPSRAERQRRREAHEAREAQSRAVDQIGERFRALSEAPGPFDYDYWDIESELDRVFGTCGVADRFLQRYASLVTQCLEDDFVMGIPSLSDFINDEVEHNDTFNEAMSRAVALGR